MEENKNSSHYSPADIQKYLEGKLSAQEMNAVEKAALDDPFLADAIEGMQNDFQQRGAHAFNKDVNELKEKLQQRINKKKKLITIAPTHLWQRIAAIAIILIGSTALVFTYLIKNESNQKAIAVNRQNEITDSSNIPKNNSTPAPLSVDSTIHNNIASNEKNKAKRSLEYKPKENGLKKIAVDNITAKDKSIASSEQASADKAKESDVAKNVVSGKLKSIGIIKPDSVNADSTKYNIATYKATAKPENALQGKIADFGAQQNRRANFNVVQGKVIDENKKPVPGATIMIKNKKTGTSTDATGNFILSTSSKDSITNVVVNSVGYEPASVQINNNDNGFVNLIQLKPVTSSLNEVVVVGYGAQKRDQGSDDKYIPAETAKEKETALKAVPSVGWPAFNNYINQNKKITTGDSTIKGKEIISFVVDKNNQLSLFKIKKSLSASHDAEALRLIMQGPSWKLLKDKKAKITIAIEF